MANANGRPPNYGTAVEREEARKVQTAASREKHGYRSMSIDGEAARLLSAATDDLTKKFGFRPTVSQVLRHVLRRPDDTAITSGERHGSR